MRTQFVLRNSKLNHYLHAAVHALKRLRGVMAGERANPVISLRVSRHSDR